MSSIYLTEDSGSTEHGKWWIYCLMMAAGGYLGAFTYCIRGGVFCNAQTGNFVLLSIALSDGNWHRAAYYFIPITAYCFGAFVSEAARMRLSVPHPLRWETVLVFIEMAAVGLLGFLPETAPVQITQVAINFIASMQYNTFRQTRGVLVATTFCTNHIRQVGIALYDLISSQENQEQHRKKLAVHLGMLAAFILGGTVSAALCVPLLGRAIWFAEIPLGLAAVRLLRTDLAGRDFRKI